jgi:hypothetical protein
MGAPFLPGGSGHLEPVLSGVGVNSVGRLDVGLDGGGRLALKYNAISYPYTILKLVFRIRNVSVGFGSGSYKNIICDL